MTLEVNKLNVSIDNKKIIKDISFSLKNGDVLAISGMNGEGKTTILKAIMNHFALKTTGSIKLNNKELTKLETYEISKLGIFYIPQNSVELEGIQTLSFLRNINKNRSNSDFTSLYKEIESSLSKFNLPQDILSRNLNVGFSGGQKKKVELLQAKVFKPSILLIDEIDSGVDVDSIKTIADFINKEKKNVITIVISHNNAFLNMVKPNKVIVINKGTIVKSGDNKLLNVIEKKGFNQFITNNKKVIQSACLFPKK